jgi:hypothetical protein
MRGLIRALKVPEERKYKNAQAIKSNRAIQQFISLGWESIVDPGPYSFSDGKIIWDKVLIGDALFLLMQVRAMTYTHEYPIVFPCQACNKPIDHTVNVLKDMDIQPLPEVSIEHVKTGEAMTVEHGGRVLQFKLLRLGDEKEIARIQDIRKFSRSQAALAVRLLEVDGVDKHGFGIIHWIEELDAGVPDEISEILDEYDCGLDTTLDVICESCFYQQDIALPLDGSFFQRPSKKKAKRSSRLNASLGKGA